MNFFKKKKKKNSDENWIKAIKTIRKTKVKIDRKFFENKIELLSY